MTNVKIHTPAGPIVAWRAGRGGKWDVRLPGGTPRETPEVGVRVLVKTLGGLAATRYGGFSEIELFEELPDGGTRALSHHNV